MSKIRKIPLKGANVLFLNELGDLARALFPPKEVREQLKEMTSATGIFALVIVACGVASVVFSTPGYAGILPGSFPEHYRPAFGFWTAVFVALSITVLISLFTYAVIRWAKGMNPPPVGYTALLLIVIASGVWADRWVMLEGSAILAKEVAGDHVTAETAHPYADQIRTAKLEILEQQKRLSWCGAHKRQGVIDPEALTLSCSHAGCKSLAIATRKHRHNKGFFGQAQAVMASARARIADYDEKGRAVIDQRIKATSKHNADIDRDRGRMENAGRAISTYLYGAQFVLSFLLTWFMLTYYQNHAPDTFEEIRQMNDVEGIEHPERAGFQQGYQTDATAELRAEIDRLKRQISGMENSITAAVLPHPERMFCCIEISTQRTQSAAVK